jgi:arylsulfatase A-like enzyme
MPSTTTQGASHADAGPEVTKGGASMRTVLWLALAFAMVATLWFVLRAGVKVFVLGGYALISRDALWMSPLGHVLLYLAASLPVLAVTRVAPRAQRLAIAAGLFAALAIHAALLPWTQVGIYAAIIFALGSGLAAGRGLARAGEARLQAAARRTAVGLALFFAVGAGTVAAFGGVRTGRATTSPARAPGAPNVLLIVFDTFRAGAMGTYGSTKGITPAVDRFAARGTVFDWAIASAGWTVPSHATMFTGRYAQRTGVDFHHRFGTREPTLAEAFGAHGYETAGFAANLHYTTWESGLDRGFQSWSDYPRSLEMVIKSTLHGQSNLMEDLLRAEGWRNRLGALRRKRLIVEPKPEGPPVDAREITDRFLHWQASREASRAWFAFLNYFDPHKPYLSPRRRVSGASPADSVRAGYEADIAFLDTHVGRLLDTLERAGTLRNMLVIITADHGEHFGEHGLQNHANSVYTALVHVPLIVRWDGHVPAGRRVSAVVSHRDLPRTIVELAGLEGSRFPGRSLVASWSDAGGSTSEAVAQHLPSGAQDPARPASDQGSVAIFDERWHLVRTMRRALEEIYEYRSDADEERNLIGTDSGTAARDRLVERLRAAIRADNADSLARISR